MGSSNSAAQAVNAQQNGGGMRVSYTNQQLQPHSSHQHVFATAQHPTSQFKQGAPVRAFNQSGHQYNLGGSANSNQLNFSGR